MIIERHMEDCTQGQVIKDCFFGQTSDELVDVNKTLTQVCAFAILTGQDDE